jgi:septal ring factor EnvC (AmiA/AmiB activator)
MSDPRSAAVQRVEPNLTMNETSSSVTYSTETEKGSTHAATPLRARIACILLAVAAVVFAFLAYREKSTVAAANTQLANANSEIAQTKGNLDKATAQSADFQSKLASANARSDDLAAQLKTSQSQVADGQSQLQKTRGQVSDLQSRLDTAKAQSANLQSQFDRATSASADLRRQLDQAKAQAADAQAQLAKAQSEATNLQPMVVKPTAGAMPVVTTFKKGFLSSRYTLHITNQKSAPLTVNVAVDGTEKMATTRIESGSSYDVDDLAAGANVAITSNGYDPLNLTVR